MQVTLLCSIAGEPSYPAGAVVDLPDVVAMAWIADGLAVPVDAAVERAVDVRPVETAIGTGGRRRR